MSRNLSVNPPLDILLFLRAGLRKPRRLGAVAPSGRALAKLITSEIVADRGPIIELGAGTGAFTRALLTRGVPEAKLVLVEADPHFARLLQKRFPAAQVLAVQAQRLRHLDPLQGRAAGAIVSGLPLLSMRRREVLGVLSGAFRRLRPDGAFYQFTYGPRCPVPAAILKRLGLRAKRVGWVLTNLPPATVYRIERATVRPSRSRQA
jgi:phospholipid N-methyltransferase